MATESSHGASTRRPVVYGGRTIRGLHERALKDGSLVFECRLRLDGKDRRIVLEATTRTDAVREYERLRGARASGDALEQAAANPTVADVFEEWLAALEARVDIRDEHLRIAASTVRVYRGHGKRLLPHVAHHRVADLKPRHLRAVVDALSAAGYAPLTVSGALWTAQAMLSFAIDQGYAATNAARDLPRHSRPSARRLTEPRILAADEFEALLSQTEDRYRAVLACYGYAALRLSEGVALRWGTDLDFEAKTLTVNGQICADTGERTRAKSASSHATLPILPALERELLAHRSRQAEVNLALVRPGAYVFARRSGKPYNYRAPGAALHRAADAAGLNREGEERITPHDLRHSCVSIALERGATPVEAQELARHSNVTTTMRIYAGLTKDGRGGAAAKMLRSGFGA